MHAHLRYVITDTVPEIATRMLEGLPRLPVLRDLAGSSYIRQERDGILIGPYESECTIAPWAKAPPDDFTFQLFEGDLERLEHNLLAAYVIAYVTPYVVARAGSCHPIVCGWADRSVQQCLRL
jgi:hypothetical protein